MPIPDYQSLMLPLLKLSSDQKEHQFKEAIETLSSEFNLTQTERQTLLPSGVAFLFDNRVGWAKTHITKAGLLESTKRSFFKITDKGLRVLLQNPDKINVQFLRQFPEYVEFIRPTNTETSTEASAQITQSEATPEEILGGAYLSIRKGLAGAECGF